MDVMTGAAPQLETILWTARNAGRSLIISRGQDPAAIRHMLDHGLVRERLGHLVLTFKGMELRRSCAPH